MWTQSDPRGRLINLLVLFAEYCEGRNDLDELDAMLVWVVQTIEEHMSYK